MKKKNKFNIFSSVLLVVIMLIFLTFINQINGKYTIIYNNVPSELNSIMSELDYKPGNILILSYSNSPRKSMVRVLTKDLKYSKETYDSNNKIQGKMLSVLNNNYSYIYKIVYVLLLIILLSDFLYLCKK